MSGATTQIEAQPVPRFHEPPVEPQAVTQFPQAHVSRRAVARVGARKGKGAEQ